jgi:murein DD-endopeptidase MepM/ murein hydrolase activator NlpD
MCAVLGALVPAGCGDADPLRGYFVDPSPRERYVHGLEEAGLGASALARDWVRAGHHALSRPTSVPTPYREAGYLDPAETRAEGFRFALRRGQRVLADVDMNGDSAHLALFVDLFVESDATTDPVLLATADSGNHRLEHVARRDGVYLLRIQPELLRGGRYTLTIEAGASLTFPVSGLDTRAIRSGFGAPRDGGRREHHGVDIFATRGTPVVAAAEGVVRRVGTRGLGGKVVWLRDARQGYSLYYAHLDSQLVTEGMRVLPGDTLGLVGNTGNARSTPPHLHFGIYGRGVGPVDPLPFVFDRVERPPDVSLDAELAGGWRRVRGAGIRLRASPGGNADVLLELAPLTPVRVVAASGAWVRVHLPDGLGGYLAAGRTEDLAPVGTTHLARGGWIRRALLGGVAVDSMAPGDEVPLLGRYGEFAYVTAPNGRSGWVVLE